jgi:hypothetical protein
VNAIAAATAARHRSHLLESAVVRPTVHARRQRESVRTRSRSLGNWRAHPETIRTLGSSPRKATTIVAVAEAVGESLLDLESLAARDDAQATETLTQIPGIGRWTPSTPFCEGSAVYTSSPATTWAPARTSPAGSGVPSRSITQARNARLPAGVPTPGSSKARLVGDSYVV